jgi:hypothetical protein
MSHYKNNPETLEIRLLIIIRVFLVFVKVKVKNYRTAEVSIIHSFSTKIAQFDSLLLTITLNNFQKE